MKLLLDTHIFLWSLSNSRKLSAEMKKLIEDDNNELWLSPISTWEVLMLIEKGRVQIAHKQPAKWMREVLQSLPIKTAPLNHEVAIKSRQIKLPHGDPADRFIVATAIVYSLVLLTVDEKIVANDHLNLCYQLKK
ncbi:MAG: PIN domain nuclease [Acidobacteria bacterium]|nr:MAG: PIN domain nuclease [Acidobacteriota bacterium]